MAKNMARIENGKVVNIEWCSDRILESDALKDMADRPVAIGDSYKNGKYYRDGYEILTPLEEARKRNAEYESALSELDEAYRKGVEDA